MNLERRNSTRRWAAGLMALVVGSGLVFGLAGAQEPAKVPDFQVVQLKHALADEMANTLIKVFNPGEATAIRIIADIRTNSILVSAPDADLAKIRTLIAQLDVEGGAGARGASESSIFRLKHVRATEMEKLLQQVLARRSPRGAIPLSIGIDERSNMIVVQAPKETIAEIQAIIANVDTPKPGLLQGMEPGPPQPMLKTFQLKFMEPDQAVQEALRLVIGNPETNRFTVDQLRRQVIVLADVNTLTTVDALLANMEHAARRPSGQDVQVRIVWLVNGLARDDAPPVPDDLKDVLPGLAKMGIDKPRLAAQTLVSVTPNTEFQAKGVTKLGETTRFALTGRYYDKNEAPGLQLTITATGASGEEICNLQTEISAPPGHLVVLGMTPTGAMTSVFVVQVLRQDAKKPGPQK